MLGCEKAKRLNTDRKQKYFMLKSIGLKNDQESKIELDEIRTYNYQDHNLDCIPMSFYVNKSILSIPKAVLRVNWQTNLSVGDVTEDCHCKKPEKYLN